MIPSGFEPETHSLEGCCSIQLSYGTDLLIFAIGCKGRHFFGKHKILDAKSYISTIVEGVIAYGKTLGGLEAADV